MDDKLLRLFFEGRTSEEETRLVTEWLDADAANMLHYQQLCRLYEMAFWYEKPCQGFGVYISKGRKIVKELAKIAAVFLLGFMLNYWLNGMAERENAMQTIYVPSGQNAQLLLSDGSKVWLNSGSTLHFPTRFTEGKRLVRLDGEGFFEVKADKEKPFVVSTSVYDIRALGTSFNVRAYKKSSNFETALLTGKVEIANHSTRNVVSLAPQEQAVLIGSQLSVVPLEETERFLWREGIICFDEPLIQVLGKLELYFDVRIDVHDSSVLDNQRHCTGKFRARDGLRHILDVLQLTNHFTYVLDEGENRITIN